MDNTERKAFEKVRPVPEFLRRDVVGYAYRAGCEGPWGVFKEYNALWQGFLLGRAQDADRKDAERWRAFINCGRIKMQGWAGVNPKNDDGYVHFGAEFWTDYVEEKYYTPEQKADAIKVLTTFADGAIKTAMGVTNV